MGGVGTPVQRHPTSVLGHEQLLARHTNEEYKRASSLSAGFIIGKLDAQVVPTGARRVAAYASIVGIYLKQVRRNASNRHRAPVRPPSVRPAYPTNVDNVFVRFRERSFRGKRKERKKIER